MSLHPKSLMFGGGDAPLLDSWVTNVGNLRLLTTPQQLGATPDGGAVICGNYSSDAKVFILVWLSKYGDYLMNRGFTQVGNLSPLGTYPRPACCADSSGNAYVALPVQDNSSKAALSVAKISSANSVTWNRQFVTGTYSAAFDVKDIQTDSSGNVYVLVCCTQADDWSEIVKWNSAGTLQWRKWLYTGVGDYVAEALCIDGSGNVYIAGYEDFGTSMTAWLTKLNSSGTHQWTKTFNEDTNNIFYGVTVDGSGSNVYCTGQMSGTAARAIAVSVTSSGSLNWAGRYYGAAAVTGTKFTKAYFYGSYVYTQANMRTASGNLSPGWVKISSSSYSTCSGGLCDFGSAVTSGLGMAFSTSGATDYQAMFTFNRTNVRVARFPHDLSKGGTSGDITYTIFSPTTEAASAGLGTGVDNTGESSPFLETEQVGELSSSTIYTPTLSIIYF